MEETNQLMLKVLKLHFKHRMRILNVALEQLREYSTNTKSTQSQYEEVKATLNGIFIHLPDEFVKYFFTLIPLPGKEVNLAVKKQNLYNINRTFMKYLEEGVPLDPLPEDSETLEVVSTCNEKQEATKSDTLGTFHSNVSTCTPTNSNPMKKTSTKRRCAPVIKATKRPAYTRGKAITRIDYISLSDCQSLQDICAAYIVKNQVLLKRQYQAKNTEVWKQLTSVRTFDAEQKNSLYLICRDLNKKLKWLRLLEAEDITDEIILDSYQDENIVLQENHMSHWLSEDPFIISNDLLKSITRFVAKK